MDILPIPFLSLNMMHIINNQITGHVYNHVPVLIQDFMS